MGRPALPGADYTWAANIDGDRQRCVLPTAGWRPEVLMVRRGARIIARVLELLLFVVAVADQGLALDPTKPFSSYLRTRFSNEDGLPSSVVHEIVQSQDGFLWLSVGSDVLTRFDGRHFTEIDYPRAHVLAIAPDGTLCVGTDGGLERIAATALNQFGRLPATLYQPGPGLGSRL